MNKLINAWIHFGMNEWKKTIEWKNELMHEYMNE